MVMKPGYILRLAVPLNEVDSSVAAVRWRILWASFYAALVALICAYFFSQSFTRRITRLRAFAEGLVERTFPKRRCRMPMTSWARWGAHSAPRRAARDLVDRLSVESAQREAILASMVEGVLAVDSSFAHHFRQ